MIRKNYFFSYLNIIIKFGPSKIFYVKSNLNISDEKNLTNKLIKLNEKN